MFSLGEFFQIGRESVEDFVILSITLSRYTVLVFIVFQAIFAGFNFVFLVQHCSKQVSFICCNCLSLKYASLLYSDFAINVFRLSLFSLRRCW